MELSNEFRVSVPVEQAWAVLTDLERIAPCMPGAELREVEGDEYRGIVKVKVGPITAQYKGTASFVEMDPSAHRAVLRAEGRDTRGQGNASATVRAELEGQEGATVVRILTDLSVTGKVAQFGRGVLADVSAKLLDQFVASLEADVLSSTGSGASAAEAEGPLPGDATPAPQSSSAGEDGAPVTAGEDGAAAGTSAEGQPTVRVIESPPAQPVDLLEAAGGSVAKRLVPAGLGVLLIVLLWRFLRRR